ncbi:MAG TPA: hypothetical protein PKM63_22135 [Panacibacter sp.]|nr:hypothetical protein [Panacibacter sp.]HNP47014.1 hypothetical protein [Panacibacter sp.]
MKKAGLLFILLITILTIYLSTVSSCTKEYSCEGCAVTDTIPSSDTTIVKDPTKIDSTIAFPYCSTCDTNQSYILNRWGLKNYKSHLCGNIYYASLDSGYIATFRGAQDCVTDTQFVVTGRFPAQTFDSDRVNVPASFANFLLYAPNNNIILAVAGGTNGTPLTLNAVLDTFNYATGIASFSFYGYAYSNKGGSVYQTGDSSYIEGSVRAKVR